MYLILSLSTNLVSFHYYPCITLPLTSFSSEWDGDPAFLSNIEFATFIDQKDNPGIVADDVMAAVDESEEDGDDDEEEVDEEEGQEAVEAVDQ